MLPHSFQMQKPSPSCEKLCEVFDFFLSKSLAPMQAESLQNISKVFDESKASRYSDIMIQNVSSNSTQEFQEILQENHVFEKLEKLDELKQTDGLSVNMKSFTFTPATPEVVSSQVIYKAKEEYVKRLKQILISLNQKIEELEPRQKEAQIKVQKANEKIQQTRQKIQTLLSNQQ